MRMTENLLAFRSKIYTHIRRRHSQTAALNLVKMDENCPFLLNTRRRINTEIWVFLPVANKFILVTIMIDFRFYVVCVHIDDG